MLKKLCITVAALLLTTTAAFADWQTDFGTSVEAKGLVVAVQNAQAEGASPRQILEVALEQTDFSAQAILTALFKADVPESEIRKAAAASGISSAIVDAAQAQSLNGNMATTAPQGQGDTQAFTPAAAATPGATATGLAASQVISYAGPFEPNIPESVSPSSF